MEAYSGSDDQGAPSKIIQGDEILGDKVLGDKVLGDKTVFMRSQLEELRDYLQMAVAAYETAQQARILKPPTPATQPYKFLDSFDLEDADNFFGRDSASAALHQAVAQARLTVLHARSGAGKTSLLHAGLAPRLIQEDRIPVFARAFNDPVLAVKRAIAPASAGPWPALLPGLTLSELLGEVCRSLPRRVQELVLILDQFEEFFVFRPARGQRQPFIEDFANCYDDKNLPVRFVIALRKDYFSDLAGFEQRISTIFQNHFRLETMSREEAAQAITAPVAKLARPVAYEQDLLAVLLDDLSRGGMKLPHLQIICTQLYEHASQAGAQTVDLAAYDHLGRAAGILGDYLNRVLAQFAGSSASLARAILKELVSSETTKRALALSVLVNHLEATQQDVDETLARLVNARLLHRDEVDGEIVYELSHEYLIAEISRWIDPAELALKQAEELLAREVTNWRIYGTLIPRDRLELIYAQHSHLRHFDDTTGECLFLSAVRADFAVDEWTRLVSRTSMRPVLTALRDDASQAATRRALLRGLGAFWEWPDVAALGDEDSIVRRQGAQALGQQTDTRAVEPLVAALKDKDTGVRKAAADALRQLRDARAMEPLVAALKDSDAGVRKAVARALGQLGNARAVEPLIAAVKNENAGVRSAVAWALGQRGDARAVEPLVAVLKDENAAVRSKGPLASQSPGPELAAQPAIVPSPPQGNRSQRLSRLLTLGQQRTPEATGGLVAALGDEDEQLRWLAALSLQGIGGGTVIATLKAFIDQAPSAVAREEAEKVLGKLTEEGT